MTEEDDKIMIVKSDRSRNRMAIKVRKKVKNSFVPNEYFKTVNIKDANDLALLFEDICLILGAPVDKAFRIYKERKEKSFPF